VAQEIVRPEFKVLGVRVMTDSNTKGAEALFEQGANQVVNVRGTMNGDTLIADQVRIISK
jgi:hypothetical protein